MELRDSTMYKADKQKGYIIQHREMYLLFCKNFKWSIIYKKIEWLCCTAENNINQLYLIKKKTYDTNIMLIDI